jgi:hypothetical protein
LLTIRIRTIGIANAIFKVDKQEYEFVDVGGPRYL